MPVLAALLLFFFAWEIVPFYKAHTPQDGHYAKCYFREITGYKCPGCGAQTAFHYLLNRQIKKSVQENILIWFVGMYLLLVGISHLPVFSKTKFAGFFRSNKPAMALIAIIFLFWILRNIRIFNQLTHLK